MWSINAASSDPKEASPGIGDPGSFTRKETATNRKGIKERMSEGIDIIYMRCLRLGLYLIPYNSVLQKTGGCALDQITPCQPCQSLANSWYLASSRILKGLSQWVGVIS